MLDDNNLESLIKAFVSLQSEDEAHQFLRDLMTDAELKEFARRWEAARMLHKKIPYTTIEKQTGLSSATIARVSKWLQEGSGGYRLLLDRLPAEEQSEDMPELTANPIVEQVEKLDINNAG